ncbi:MAG TPA: MBL fold metallo-hydrolase [Candidatus Magasanikbacteria bacterium]|nr:MBL fold metallo-hydrolase [Candidatus Magasanikbacteria bacterium]
MKYVFYLVVLSLAVAASYLFEVPENSNPQVEGVKENGQNNLEITFLDIGQGDATYITFANGEDMLVDCAIDGRILEALGRVMDWKDKEIDYLVVTHPDLDHYGGCEEVMNRFEIKHVVYNGLKKEDSKLWKSFDAAAHMEGEYMEITHPTDWIIASTTLTFSYPDHEIGVDSKIPGRKIDTGSNDTSIVMKVFHGNTSVLLMADAEDALEKYLIETYGQELDADILKLGHHGSDTSSGEDLLELVSPADAIVSAGIDNSYGHPSRRVLKRLSRVSSTVWRTDEQGDIIVVIGENDYSVSTKK